MSITFGSTNTNPTRSLNAQKQQRLLPFRHIPYSRSVRQKKIEEPALINYTVDTVEQQISYTMNYGKYNTLYIIGGVDVGGSNKFITDFQSMCKGSVRITTAAQFNKIAFKCNDILFVQHLVKDITPQHICALYAKCNVRIMINIHDYYYLSSTLNINNNIPHNQYLSNSTVSTSVKDMFSIAEAIIHPSRFTYDQFSKYFPTNNFVISPHIDYTILDSTLAIPKILQNTINVGVMHGNSAYKGQEYITYLQNTYKQYNSHTIRFHIVGESIPTYTENEFFEFIVKYNIHFLLALNKWGETYCYSISKYMKSGLPILYNNLGAFKERIPIKPHYMKVFDTEVAFNANDKLLLDARFKAMMDFVITNNGTVERGSINIEIQLPAFYSSIVSKWEKIDPMKVENVILLSSSIVTSKNPLSYTGIRSVYSNEERFQQTLKNIHILRYKIPNSAIILIDPTDVPTEWKEYLKTLVDTYIDANDDPMLKILTDTCLNKGVAECAQLLKCLDRIGEYKNTKNIFKLTGRYYLSKSFRYSNFCDNMVHFKTVPPSSVFFEKVPACFTFLFKVPYIYMDKLAVALSNTIQKGKETLASIETILPYEFDKSIVRYDATLGVSGFVGPNKHFLNDVV
jgi:hypothetical protein